MIDSPVRFCTVSTYQALVVNSVDDAINTNDIPSFNFLVEHLDKITTAHDLEMGIEHPAEWTVENLTTYRDTFLELTKHLYFGGVDFNSLPSFNN